MAPAEVPASPLPVLSHEDISPRPLEEIEEDIRAVKQDIARMLGEVTESTSGAR